MSKYMEEKNYIFRGYAEEYETNMQFKYYGSSDTGTFIITRKMPYDDEPVSRKETFELDDLKAMHDLLSDFLADY